MGTRRTPRQPRAIQPARSPKAEEVYEAGVGPGTQVEGGEGLDGRAEGTCGPLRETTGPLVERRQPGPANGGRGG